MISDDAAAGPDYSHLVLLLDTDNICHRIEILDCLIEEEPEWVACWNLLLTLLFTRADDKTVLLLKDTPAEADKLLDSIFQEARAAVLTNTKVVVKKKK